MANAPEEGGMRRCVARLENAHHMPSLDLVTRYAAALGRRVDIRLVPGEYA